MSRISKPIIYLTIFAVVALFIALLALRIEILRATIISLANSTITKVHRTASPIAPSVLDTSTWKTYRNEKYGFEFKHPVDWYWNSESSYNRASVRFWPPGSDNVFSVHIDQNESIEGRIANFNSLIGFDPQKKSEILVGGEKAEYLFGFPVNSHGIPYEEVLISHSNKLFDITKTSVNSSTFKTILYTFKFFEPTPVGKVFPDDEIVLRALTGGETLVPGRTHPIKWSFQSNGPDMPDFIDICLVGLNNSSGTTEGPDFTVVGIAAKNIYAAKSDFPGGLEPCLEFGAYYRIAKVSTTDEVYNWTVPDDLADRFESKPANYIIELASVVWGGSVNTTGEGPGGDSWHKIIASWSASPLYLQATSSSKQ